MLRALLLLLPASWVARLAAVDYEALRVEARNLFASKIEEVRGSIATMQKAQRAAEQALDMLFQPAMPCVPRFPMAARRRGVGMRDLAALLQLLKSLSLACFVGVLPCQLRGSGAHARFMFRRRPSPRLPSRKRARQGIRAAFRIRFLGPGLLP